MKDVIAYLRISVGDYRRQNFIRIINKPQRYISRCILLMKIPVLTRLKIISDAEAAKKS